MARLDQIGNHKTVIYTHPQSDGHTCVKYHQTDVVKFNRHEIILNSGGWSTNTTKLRMNQTSNQFGLGYQVFQKDYAWYVDYQGATLDFEDHMKLRR